MSRSEPQPFPNDLYQDTYCGERHSLFATHGVYSETRKQRGLLHGLAYRNGYTPPPQTCCHHQVVSLARELKERLQPAPAESA